MDVHHVGEGIAAELKEYWEILQQPLTTEKDKKKIHSHCKYLAQQLESLCFEENMSYDYFLNAIS